MISNCKNFQFTDFSSIFNNVETILTKYEKPIIFINDDLTNLLNFDDENKQSLLTKWYFSRKRDEIHNRYLEMELNKKRVYVYFFNISNSLKEKYPQLAATKMVIIDRKDTQYIVKEPLRLEWRTISKPISLFNKTTKEFEYEWDYFDFTCYTLGEIRYSGDLLVYNFSKEELRKLKAFHQKRKNLTSA